MISEINILLLTTITVAAIHTLSGPDHYLPFIFMAQARNWSISKTITITILCGLGHIASSVILAGIGVAMGIGIQKVQFFESYRGNIAAWMFITFGLVYLIWGIRKALQNKPHTHYHIHHNQQQHAHLHIHSCDHAHVHTQANITPDIQFAQIAEKQNTTIKSVTPWVLFTIFVFGPCEPLIPIVMYGAAQNAWYIVYLTVALFSVSTIVSMVAMVLIGKLGFSAKFLKKQERYMHAIAGGTIMLCGLGMVFLGL